MRIHSILGYIRGIVICGNKPPCKQSQIPATPTDKMAKTGMLIAATMIAIVGS